MKNYVLHIKCFKFLKIKVFGFSFNIIILNNISLVLQKIYLLIVRREMKDYEPFLSKLFKKNRYYTSDVLIKILMKNFNISDGNARVVINRYRGKIYEVYSKKIKLNKNRFIYTSAGFLDFQELLAITRGHLKSLYRILKKIESNFIVSIAEINKLTIKNDDIYKILNELENKKIIKRFEYKNITFYKQYSEEYPRDLVIKKYDDMKINSIFNMYFVRWLNNCNIIDNRNIIYRSVEILNELAYHNNLYWDAFAYTKTTGIRIDNLEENNTLVVVDSCVTQKYDEEDFMGFKERIQKYRNSVNGKKRKIMPIILYSCIDKNVLYECKNMGIMAFKASRIFGDNVYEIIEKIGNIYYKINTGDLNLNIDIQEALLLIKEVGQRENLNNLKGTFFEYLLLKFLEKLYPYCTIEKNYYIKDRESGKKYEYDFIIHPSETNEIILIEAKAYKSTSKIKLGWNKKEKKLEKDSVKWFFEKKLDVFKKNYQYEERKIVKLSFITTGIFDDEANNYLEKNKRSKLKPEKMEICYDYETLISECKNLNLMQEIEHIIQYFGYEEFKERID